MRSTGWNLKPGEGIGTGGFKANISPLIAEQYKRTKLFIVTTPAGERVLVDPALTTAKIYMYFYMFINIGALIGQIGMTYSEKVRISLGIQRVLWHQPNSTLCSMWASGLLIHYPPSFFFFAPLFCGLVRTATSRRRRPVPYLRLLCDSGVLLPVAGGP